MAFQLGQKFFMKNLELWQILENTMKCTSQRECEGEGAAVFMGEQN